MGKIKSLKSNRSIPVLAETSVFSQALFSLRPGINGRLVVFRQEISDREVS